jgi:LPXTG-motif cell wall-anchored protein
MALKSDGTVWCWGDNQYGQLSNIGAASSAIPVQVSGLAGIAAISAGRHSMALQTPDAPSTAGCSPSNGARDVACDTAISWQPVPFVNHDFQLSKDSGFVALLADVKNSTTNSYTPASPLDQATTYYWRVRSRAINLTSAWATGSFTTVGAVPKPTMILTAPGTTTPTAPSTGSSTQWIFTIIAAVIAGILGAVLAIVFTRSRKKPSS